MISKIKITTLFFVVLATFSCGSTKLQSHSEQAVAPINEVEKPPFVQVVPEGWTAMMDGNSLEGWEKVRNVGEAQPYIYNGVLTLPMSVFSSMTGLCMENEYLFPVVNYAIYYEARRIEGNDIFGGLSFPYKNSYATLVVGGWGGSICGLSCIDGECAFENETATVIFFEDNVWYPIYLRVTNDSIRAEINDITVVDIATAGRRIHLRGGTIAPSLTFFTYMSGGQFRNMRMKRL